LVADHQVIVAPLLFDTQLGIGEPYRVVKTDLSDQRAVGWSDETKLLVGGSPIPGTKSTLVEITIDGSGQQSVPRSVDATESLVVDMLSVLPAGPQGNARFAMFDTNGAAYVVYGQQVGPLTSGRASPSPLAGSARPAAPFFLDTDRRAT